MRALRTTLFSAARGDAYRPRALTVRERIALIARGAQPEPRRFVSGRLTRALGIGVSSNAVEPGDGAHEALKKPYLQHVGEADTRLTDGRDTADHGRDRLFCKGFNSREGCERPDCSFVHACNWYRCGAWRRGTTGCINIGQQCCLARGPLTPNLHPATTPA